MRSAGRTPTRPASLHKPMYLLYLDDAGSPPNPQEEYFVLGGVALFEPQIHWLSQQLDQLAETLFPQLSPRDVEFHASTIFSRRSEPWKQLNKRQAIEVMRRVLDIFASSYDTARAFAVAIHKPSYPNHDLMEVAFEDLCSRFDLMLERKKSISGAAVDRGLFVVDKSSYESSLQKLALEFRSSGTRWRTLKNIVEVPLFVDSKASRAIQVADHVAYAVFRRYNAGDTSYLDRIVNRFDESDGTIHGLVHKQTMDARCRCPACLSRARPQGASP